MHSRSAGRAPAGAPRLRPAAALGLLLLLGQAAAERDLRGFLDDQGAELEAERSAAVLGSSRATAPFSRRERPAPLRPAPAAAAAAAAAPPLGSSRWQRSRLSAASLLARDGGGGGDREGGRGRGRGRLSLPRSPCEEGGEDGCVSPKPPDGWVALRCVMKLGVVVLWLVLLLYILSTTKHSMRDDAFCEFEEKTRKTAEANVQVQRLTLCFLDELEERRFLEVNGRLLCQRMRWMCFGIAIYAAFVMSIAERHDGSWVINPTLLHPLSSRASLVYNVAGVAIIAMCAILAYSTKFWSDLEHNAHLEKLVLSWLVVILIVLGAFFSRWFVAKMHGEDPGKVFVSYGYDGEFTYILVGLVLYVTLFTPLRFVALIPFCVSVPLMYMALTAMYGLPDSHSLQKAFDEFEESIKIHNDLTYVMESAFALSAIVIFALVGKYLNEFHFRAGFMRMHNSFNLLQEVCSVEELTDDAKDSGTTPVAKARAALAAALQALEVLAATPGVADLVGKRLENATAKVEFARRVLQNTNKLFEVKAEDLLKGATYEGNTQFLAYLEQKDEEDNCVSIVAATTTKRTNVTKAGHPFSKPIKNSVKVANAADHTMGWGEAWDFNSLALARRTGNSACLFVGEVALVQSDWGEALDVEKDCMRAWVRSIHGRYLPNGYHNEAHAAQVAHFSMWFAKQLGWLGKADDVQVCALMVAALGHDVGHIGRTNLFCAKSTHSFSVIWNDRSVLENMHTATCFSLMRGDADLLQNLEVAVRNRFRAAVVRFILATDIKEHNSSLAKVKGMLEDETFLKPPDESADHEAWMKFEEDIVVGGEQILKTSDIAHSMLPWEQHREWSYRVQLEFFEQGDEERALGLPVSPLCERKDCNMAGGQEFFISHFGKGSFGVMLQMAESPEGQAALRQCLQQGDQNIQKWKVEEKVFQPLTLSMQTVVSIFGKAEAEIIFPYAFEKDKVRICISTDENLAEMAKFKKVLTGH